MAAATLGTAAATVGADDGTVDITDAGTVHKGMENAHTGTVKAAGAAGTDDAGTVNNVDAGTVSAAGVVHAGTVNNTSPGTVPARPVLRFQCAKAWGDVQLDKCEWKVWPGPRPPGAIHNATSYLLSHRTRSRPLRGLEFGF